MEKEGITDSSFRRLASYFAVVGINEDMSMVNNDGPLDITSLRFNSALQDRFPQDDVSNDAPFPNGICYFCMVCALDTRPPFRKSIPPLVEFSSPPVCRSLQNNWIW